MKQLYSNEAKYGIQSKVSGFQELTLLEKYHGEGNDLCFHPTVLDIIGESGELVLSAASPKSQLTSEALALQLSRMRVLPGFVAEEKP